MADIFNSFDLDSEGWRVYDYERHRDGWPIYSIKPHWEFAGGVDGGGYVWADESVWTIDTPENPHSILAFFMYRKWCGLGPLDLRNAEVSVHLRGDGLDLQGARCFFWVVSTDPAKHCRWHCVAHPFTVHRGSWGARQGLVLPGSEASWHRSWVHPEAKNTALDGVLADVGSYGFSLVGFAAPVTGKLCMDDVRVRTST